MFEINLLNKKGLQTETVDSEKNDRPIMNENINLSKIKNDVSGSSGYYYLVLIVFVFFAYIYYFNQSKFNQDYENIYPANVLSIMQINDVNNNISSIKIEGDYFSVINSYEASALGYNQQVYFDSLFNIDSFLSIDGFDNDLFLKFNWYILQDNSWSIKDLFEKITLDKTLSLKIDFLNNKIISVADYNELILLFNVLSKLEVEHIFKYQIELFKETIESKEKYYKIIISEYD